MGRLQWPLVHVLSFAVCSEHSTPLVVPKRSQTTLCMNEEVWQCSSNTSCYKTRQWAGPGPQQLLASGLELCGPVSGV